MTPQHHYIETQRLELHLPDFTDVNEFISTVSVRYQEKILPVLTGLFDTMTSPDEIIQISEIKIELGEASFEDWEDRLIECVAKGVQRSIDKIRNEALKDGGTVEPISNEFSNSSKAGTKASTAEAFLQRFIFFLRHGYINGRSLEPESQIETVEPVHNFTGIETGDALESCILKCLREHPAIQTYLRNALAASKPMTYRLIKQFSTIFCDRLLDCIAKSQETVTRKRSIREILDVVEDVFPPADRSTFTFQKRAFLFACCLDLSMVDLKTHLQELVLFLTFTGNHCRLVATDILYRYVTRIDLTTNEHQIVEQFASEIHTLKHSQETAGDTPLSDVPELMGGTNKNTPGVSTRPKEANVPLENTAEEILPLQRKEPETVFVDNVGVVLLSPFLPAFFDALDLLNSRKSFVSQDAATRAVHLLHYLSTGREKAREYHLLLPKIICALPVDLPISRDIELTEKEKKEAIGLLNSVIKHWSALKNTSPDGLRETFLARSGKLDLSHDVIKLVVEVKSIDLLLDRLPWSISFIRFPWLDRIITIEWYN